MRRLRDGHAGGAEGAEHRLHVIHLEVHRAAGLAVAGMFAEEQGLALAGELGEQRHANAEAMLPVDGEAQALHVERQGGVGVQHAQLRDDSLGHGGGS